MSDSFQNLHKIAFFLSSLNGGGAERVTVLLANSLAARGFQVDMLLANATGVYLSILDKRIGVINLHSRSTALAIPGLVDYLRQTRPDVLLSAVENANTWAVIAAKLAGSHTPVLLTEHSNWSQQLAHQPTLKERILFLFSARLYPLAQKVIAVSSGIRADLLKTMRLAPAQVVTIYNPVVPLDLDDLAAVVPNHPWFASPGAPVIVSVGRLTREKDFKTLLSAFHLVRQQTECRLIILGEGPERANLQALIRQLGLEDTVDMPGFVTNPFAWLAHANLFVLSSLYEGLPTVLIEALACGKPVVSTDCISGPAEILDDGKYGDLVPVGDAPAMAKAILKNLATPRDSTVLRQRASLYSIQNATDAYIKTMLDVISYV